MTKNVALFSLINKIKTRKTRKNTGKKVMGTRPYLVAQTGRSTFQGFIAEIIGTGRIAMDRATAMLQWHNDHCHRSSVYNILRSINFQSVKGE